MRILARAGMIPVLLAALAGPLAAEKIRNHFDADAPMREPGFFDFAVLGAGGRSRWMVMADPNPPSAPNRVVQTVLERSPESLAAALRRGYLLRDGRVTVSIRREPVRAGLVFRMRGEKDFLALLLEQPSGDARLTAYRDGKPTELARGLAVPTRPWSTLSVELKGNSITASLDGANVLEGVDPDPAEGRAGFVQAGPGAASFDEFVIETP